MSTSVDADIDAFLAGSPFAVAGASNARHKYGNRVLRRYWGAGREAIPINPSEPLVEGAPCYPNLAAAPQPIHAVSIITPPEVSAQIVDDALALGIRFLWFQPGAEHPGAIERARRAGCVVIADGPCVLAAAKIVAARDSVHSGWWDGGSVARGALAGAVGCVVRSK